MCSCIINSKLHMFQRTFLISLSVKEIIISPLDARDYVFISIHTESLFFVLFSTYIYFRECLGIPYFLSEKQLRTHCEILVYAILDGTVRSTWENLVPAVLLLMVFGISGSKILFPTVSVIVGQPSIALKDLYFFLIFHVCNFVRFVGIIFYQCVPSKILGQIML